MTGTVSPPIDDLAVEVGAERVGAGDPARIGRRQQAGERRSAASAEQGRHGGPVAAQLAAGDRPGTLAPARASRLPAADAAATGRSSTSRRHVRGVYFTQDCAIIQ